METYNDGCGKFYGKVEYDSNGNPLYFPLGNGFDVDDVYIDIETRDVSYGLSTEFMSTRVSEECSPADLTTQNFTSLAKKGFSVNINNLKYFVQAIDNEIADYQQNYLPKYRHSFVGWDKLQDCGVCYKYEDIVFDSQAYPNFVSEYHGRFDIKLAPNPNVEIAEQLKLIKEQVLGHVPLEAILAVGACAVVNGYISDDIESPNIIVHLTGNSSTGKTTATQLAEFIACKPNLLANSFMMSWLGTENSIISRIKGNYGMPVTFDEISKFQGRNMTNLVYSLSDGREKDRCDKTGNTKEITKYDTWKTAILSTGEKSLVGSCAQNMGIVARVIELNCQFTDSAQHANKIKRGVMAHYGHIAPYFAKHIFHRDKNDILNIHEKYETLYASKSQAQGLAMRVATNVAVILTAAELMNDCFKLNLDVNGIMELFLEAEEMSTLPETLADKAYFYLVDKVNENINRFVKVENHYDKRYKKVISEETPVTYGERWGKIIYDYDSHTAEANIIYTRCKRLLREGGFESSRVALRAMNDAGYLDCDGDRNTRDRKISKDDCSSASVVIIKLHDASEEDVEINQDNLQADGKSVTESKIRSQIDKLIDDCSDDEPIAPLCKHDEETDDVVTAEANDDVSDEADDDSIDDFDFEEGDN